MTTACLAFLGIALALYLAASLAFQGHLWLGHPAWERWGRRGLLTAVALHALGLLLHVLFAPPPWLANMTFVISLVVIAFAAAGLLLERFTPLRHFNLVLAPLAFLGTLYPLLMPVRFEESASILLRYPWLGTHVLTTLLGQVGFALSFCAAAAYLLQSRALKRGRLNRFLPALDTSAQAAFHAAAWGFFLFSMGLAMGAAWMFGAPGESLRAQDPKILLALPTWGFFAAYLYLRGVRGRHGSRLKWLVITGFTLGLVNYLVVPHQFAG